MEWTEEIVARLRELWKQGLSTAEIGRQLNVTKNAVVGKAHRLGLEARPSPIRRASAKKDAKVKEIQTVEEKIITKEVKVSSKAENIKAELLLQRSVNKDYVIKDDIQKAEEEVKPVEALVKTEVKPKKVKLDFISPAELPKRRSYSECCWPIGDPGTKGFHFCGAQAVPGKPYCLEHVQVAYVKLRDRRNNVA